MLADVITVILIITGVALLTVGAASIYGPLGFILPGLFCLLAGRNLAQASKETA